MKHDGVWWLWQIVAPSTIEGHSENGDVRLSTQELFRSDCILQISIWMENRTC